MYPCNEERNAEIAAMRKRGVNYREIAEQYGITITRVQQICAAFGRYGNTKDEILLGRELKKASMKMLDEYMRKRTKGRKFAVRTREGETWLTEITVRDTTHLEFKAESVLDAAFFTLEEAREMAEEHGGIACLIP